MTHKQFIKLRFGDPVFILGGNGETVRRGRIAGRSIDDEGDLWIVARFAHIPDLVPVDRHNFFVTRVQALRHANTQALQAWNKAERQAIQARRKWRRIGEALADAEQRNS